MALALRPVRNLSFFHIVTPHSQVLSAALLRSQRPGSHVDHPSAGLITAVDMRIVEWRAVLHVHH